MSNIKGKKVVVVGGNGLIGKSISKGLVDDGASVVVADINETRDFPWVKIDIQKEASIDSCINEAQTKVGGIDVVINCAYPKTKDFNKDFYDVEYDTFCNNLNTHLGGYFLVSQRFAHFFKRNGTGSIINFGSIYGYMAPKFDVYSEVEFTLGPEYAAIKSGIIHLTKFMAKRLLGDGIRVNCVSPGGVLDGQPKEFLDKYNSYCSNIGMIKPEDLQGVISFLVSDSSRAITGQNIIIDDGFSL